MHHRVACLVLWGLSVLALHSQALSQEVRIVKKPLPAGYQYDQWAVSHSQKNVPDAFLADGIWSSEEKAMAVVNRLKNARRTGDGFDIAIILVEVSGSPIGEGKAAKLVKDAKEVTKIAKLTAKAKKIADEGAAALAKERKIGSTLRDYVKQTQGAYKRAAEAKKELTSSTGKVSRQVFDKVNNQIAEYNRMRDAAVTMSSQLAAAKDERVAIDLELKSAQKKLRKADPDAVTDDAGIDDETSDDSSSLLNSLPALAALTAAELGDRLEATAPSKTSPEEDILSLREKALEKSKLDAKMSAKREMAIESGGRSSFVGTWTGDIICHFQNSLNDKQALTYEFYADGSGRLVRIWTTYGVDGSATVNKPETFSVRWKLENSGKKVSIIVSDLKGKQLWDDQWSVNGNAITEEYRNGDSRYTTTLKKQK